jgi:C-terminal processing protease CtpA/Prc
MQNPALGQKQEVPQQSTNLQDRQSDRSTFSQRQRDANGSRDDHAQQYNARDDRSQQSSSSSQARTHSANRAGDLRGPDIGLWFDRSARDGLVISDISNRGAISKLGFHEGDRIVSVNGHRVAREADFIQYLIGDNVATGPVDVVVVRDGRDETIQVNPSVLMQDYGYAEQADPLEQFGIVLDDRYNDKIVVWRVIPRSPAYYAGFRPGDVLTTFHDQPLTTAQAFEQTIVGTNPGEVAVQVRRGDRNRNLTVDVPRFDGRGERRTAMRPNLERRDSYDPNAGQQSGQQYGSDSSINNQPNAAPQSDQQNQQGYRSNRDSGSRRGMLRGNR